MHGPGDFEFDFRQAPSGPGAPDGATLTVDRGGEEDPAGPNPCKKAPGDRKPTAEEGGGVAPTTWTPDWTAQMLMGEVVLVGELVGKHGQMSPMSGMFEGGLIDGQLPSPLEVGFAYPVSIHLVRAKEHLTINRLQETGGGGPKIGPDPIDPPHLEAGTFHLARYCIRPDGFEHVITASEPTEGKVGGVGFGESFLHRERLFSGDVARIADAAIGFDLDFAAYLTPFVQETSLRSYLPFCAALD